MKRILLVIAIIAGLVSCANDKAQQAAHNHNHQHSESCTHDNQQQYNQPEDNIYDNSTDYRNPQLAFAKKGHHADTPCHRQQHKISKRHDN